MFSLAWAAEVLKARTIGDLSGTVRSVCTDTRQGAEGALFFALQGENSDGHAYVARAFAAGAAAAVVSQEIADAPGTLLLVPDTLRALGDLAGHYRRRFAIPVVGVTGSVGKTSTKEMIAAVLRTKYCTLASAKNFNNEIGVPLTLFELTDAHEAAVIEMGMRGLGQIDRLAEIAQPTVGVITNIGYAHMELLGSQENIAQAKSELLARLPAGGTAILPVSPKKSVDTYVLPTDKRAVFAVHRTNGSDDEIFQYLKSRILKGCRLLTFGPSLNRPGDICLYPMADLEDGTQVIAIVNGQEIEFALHVPGRHHLRNAEAALAVAVALEVPLTAATASLEAWQGADGRMVLRRVSEKNITILDDCYNAGPESMESALTTLDHMPGPQKVAILGDMKELGDFTAEAHRLIGQKAAQMSLRALMTVGELAAGIEKEMQQRLQGSETPLPEFHHFADSEAAAEAIPALIHFKDIVLVKGSRAMEMEKIVAVLIEETGTSAHD